MQYFYMRVCFIISLLLLLTANAAARDIKGKIKDARTGEEIIGAGKATRL